MSAKEQAIAMVSALPEDVTWAQAIEAIKLHSALDHAEQQIARGEGIRSDRAERRIADVLERYSSPTT